MSPAIQGLISSIVSAIVMPVLEILFALTVIYFIWGVAALILFKDNAEKREESQRHILWGVIGMFIMVTSYGIIRFIASSIGVNSPF